MPEAEARQRSNVCRNPPHYRRRERGGCEAEGEGGAHRRAPDLRREPLCVVAEPGTIASGDQKIRRQPQPEETRRIVEMAAGKTNAGIM
jgi:hypothetical protein